MKSIQLALNAFPSLPLGLIDSSGNQLEEVSFSIEEIYVHYLAAKYGDHPRPALGTFEFAHLICDCDEWRMKGDGIGIGTEAKRNLSNELAKGFARWFMYTYLGHTYFSPFEHAVQAPPNSDGHYWVKVGEGDAPDYVCGPSATDVNVLEVKGRYSSVTFDTLEFETFREQVTRARLLDGSHTEISVKSFIFAARWATESHPNVKPKLWVEDPWTPGTRLRPMPREAGAAMIRGHYADLVRRMGLYELATALLYGEPVDFVAGSLRIVWVCTRGPYQKAKFVEISPPTPVLGSGTTEEANGATDAFPWVQPFLGMDLAVFESVVTVAQRGDLTAEFLSPLNLQQQRRSEGVEEPGGVFFLRDGLAAGPMSHFVPVGILDINQMLGRGGQGLIPL